jgi:NAD(P)H-hydrate repair Nnr-like enzyme with NAD(P)H-hydrate dehydratase domain
MEEYAKMSLSLARKREMYVVLDADVPWMIQKEPSLIKGYIKVVLTPNVVEFKRLSGELFSLLNPIPPPELRFEQGIDPKPTRST